MREGRREGEKLKRQGRKYHHVLKTIHTKCAPFTQIKKFKKLKTWNISSENF